MWEKAPMKTTFTLALGLLTSLSAFANGPINLNDDVIVCAKSVQSSFTNAYSVFVIRQSTNQIYYENNSGGAENDRILSRTVQNGRLIVTDNSGSAETVTVDLNRGVGTWVENAYPNNVQMYPFCMSFSSYNPAQVSSWMHQIGILH